MKSENIRKVNDILHAIATHYMTSFQGDILLDQVNIIETLDLNGEIECYVAKSHFDTEVRFSRGKSISEGRKDARELNWGDYIVTIYQKDDDITYAVESSTAPRLLRHFPIERIMSCECVSDKTDKLNIDYLVLHCEYDLNVETNARHFKLNEGVEIGDKTIKTFKLDNNGSVTFYDANGYAIFGNEKDVINAIKKAFGF